MEHLLTTRAVAEKISNDPSIQGSVEEWQVRRLYEDGDLPDPQRFAGKRILTCDMLTEILAALRTRGWLPSAEANNPENDTTERML